jgi:hypothetical protein
MSHHDHPIIELPLSLQATTSDPFIADLARTSPETQARVEQYRERLAAAGPPRRIYD